MDRIKQEGQPVADLGNGRYRNPILAGNFPDPSVVRDGKDYYLTHSSNDSTPGLLLWHSRDLVNWEPVGYALREFIGDVWAPDLVFYKGLYYIYFPARVTNPDGKSRQTCFVITARTASGLWSAPIDLNLGGIDPGHVADESGNRYLYVDGGRMIGLTPDGLQTKGRLEKIYSGWAYPEEWDVECMCLESPKLVSRQGFFYLVSAQGGTAGPSTSHMIVVARSKSPAGPWVNSPLNPLLRTASRDERWWSQGHGTLIEATDGTWWIMYHGFENDFRTLGRQTLLMPANHSYEVVVEISVPATAEGGLLLYYDPAHFAGAALKKGLAFSYLRSKASDRIESHGGLAFLRLRNIQNDAAAYFSADGLAWTKFETGFDMSGYHREILGGWGSLRVALFAAGEGTVIFKNFRYRGLDGHER